MRILGLILIFLALAIPIPWFINLAKLHPAAEVFSLYLGSSALIAMGFGQFLITRMPGLEPIFGGQDKIYVLHKWLAFGGILCLGLHDIIDADIDGLGRESGLNDIAEDVGEITYYGMLILTVVTITTFIPYHLWRASHKFIGGFFILGAFHYIFILKPFSLNDPVGLYVLSFCILGTASYLYMLLLYTSLIPGPARYEVTKINRLGDMAEILLKPVGRGIQHLSGQFAFINFDVPGLDETHPFTISQSPSRDRELRFTIKAAGDYTDTLNSKLTVGTSAKVYGAYGRFQRRKNVASEIWIGAGAGITPFLSWAGDLEKSDHGNIHLFYSIRTRGNAPYINELQEIADKNPNFTLHIIETSNVGRLTAQTVFDDADIELKNSNIYFCGPALMRDTIKEGLSNCGLPSSRFHFEHFEIRTGLGLFKGLQAAKNVLKFFRRST